MPLINLLKKLKENGVDIFRVFDALNDLEQLKVGIDAVKKAGGLLKPPFVILVI